MVLTIFLKLQVCLEHLTIWDKLWFSCQHHFSQVVTLLLFKDSMLHNLTLSRIYNFVLAFTFTHLHCSFSTLIHFLLFTFHQGSCHANYTITMIFSSSTNSSRLVIIDALVHVSPLIYMFQYYTLFESLHHIFE